MTYEALYAELASLVADEYISFEPKKINKTILTKEG